MRNSRARRGRFLSMSFISVGLAFCGFAVVLCLLYQNDYRAVLRTVADAGAGVAVVVLVRGVILAACGLAWWCLLRKSCRCAVTRCPGPTHGRGGSQRAVAGRRGRRRRRARAAAQPWWCRWRSRCRVGFGRSPAAGSRARIVRLIGVALLMQVAVSAGNSALGCEGSGDRRARARRVLRRTAVRRRPSG